MKSKILIALVLCLVALTGCASNAEVDNDINTEETETSHIEAGDAFVNYDTQIYNKSDSSRGEYRELLVTFKYGGTKDCFTRADLNIDYRILYKGDSVVSGFMPLEVNCNRVKTYTETATLPRNATMSETTVLVGAEFDY